MTSHKISIGDFTVEKVTPIEILLYSYIAWLFFRNGFVDTERNVFYLSTTFGSMFYFIEPILLFSLLIASISRLKVHNAYLELLISSIILLSVFLFSIVINIENIIFFNSIKFFFGYLKFPLLIFIVSSLTCIQDNLTLLRRLFKLSIICLLIQAIFNFMWFFNIFIFPNSRRLISGNPDWAYGSMENTLVLSISFTLLIAFSIYHLYFQSKNRIMYLFLLIFALFQIVLAESKVNFATITISIMFSILVFSKKINFFKAVVLPSLFFVVGFFLAIQVYGNSLGGFLKVGSVFDVISALYYYADRVSDISPKIVFFNTIIEIQDTFYEFMFGMGPGVFSSHFAYQNPSNLSSKYFIPLVVQNLNYFGNSVLTSPKIGFYSIWGDLGLLGLLTYLFILIYPLVIVSVKIQKIDIKMLKYAFIWFIFGLNLILNLLFLDILYYGFPIIFYLIFGLIILKYLSPIKSNVKTNDSHNNL